jgi:hypothetical protein
VTDPNLPSNTDAVRGSVTEQPDHGREATSHAEHLNSWSNEINYELLVKIQEVKDMIAQNYPRTGTDRLNNSWWPRLRKRPYTSYGSTL